MEPVRQLDQDDPDVVHHGQEHLAKILRLPGFLGVEAELVDLGEPVDDVGNVPAEILFDLLQWNDRVLHDVVQQSDTDTTGVQLHVGQDIGHRQRMVEVRLTRFTGLSVVLVGRKAIGFPQHFQVVGRMGPLDFGQHLVKANHGPSLRERLAASNRPRPRFRRPSFPAKRPFRHSSITPPLRGSRRSPSRMAKASAEGGSHKASQRRDLVRRRGYAPANLQAMADGVERNRDLPGQPRGGCGLGWRSVHAPPMRR